MRGPTWCGRSTATATWWPTTPTTMTSGAGSILATRSCAAPRTPSSAILGVCPAFFRPPHGQRTPFMRWVADDQHVRLVMWDVSASDWTTTDERVVARRVLRSVRPGSIVDLHDGLDGKPFVDRSVVARALPLILDGLHRRGLRPVRLDRLIGGPAYRPCG